MNTIKKEIYLEKAGTLHKFLTSREKDNVTHLKLSGFINSKDFDVLDDMCTSYGEFIGESVMDEEFVIDDNEPPFLKILDMGECFMEGETTLPYFTYHSKLEEVILPKNITKTGYDIDPVFQDSERLKKVIFPDTLKEISYCSFMNCDLQEVTLPDSLESIESYAFSGNRNLKEIQLPKNVSFMIGSSFGYCNIEKFELDKENRHFSEIDGVLFSKDKTKLVAFPSAYKKTSYLVPEGVKTIGYEAFCSAKFTNIILPQSLEIIEGYAFESCYNLKSIEIPDCVKEMGSYVFRFCTALERVRLPNTITVLKESTFVGCSNLKELEIPASVKIIENGAVNGAHNLEKLTLHEGLEEINDDLCYTKIGKVFVPKTVRKILSGTPLFARRNAFEYEIDRDNPYLCSLNGSVYSKDGTVMIYACKGKTNSFEVPNGVEKIEEYVFLWSKISKIHLPESLKSIGHRCFDGCEELSEICLPASLVAMDFRAFDDCKNLEKMICLSTTPPEITNPSADCWKFTGDSKKLVLYVPKESLKTYQKTQYWKDIKRIKSLELK